MLLTFDLPGCQSCLCLLVASNRLNDGFRVLWLAISNIVLGENCLRHSVHVLHLKCYII